MIYALVGQPVRDERPAPNILDLTVNSTPSAFVQGVYYQGNAGTFYLLALVAMPAWGDLSAIKFCSRPAAFSVPAISAARLHYIGQQLPMVYTGANYYSGNAAGVVIIADGPNFSIAQGLYVLVLNGQYRLT